MIDYRMLRKSQPKKYAKDSMAWRLDKLAREAGSLSELAKKSGISNSALSRCFNGGDPSVATATAICNVAEVSIDWFLTGKEHPSTVNDSNSTRIPFFQAEASAGPGLIAAEDHDEKKSVLIPAGILPATGGSAPHSFCAIQAKGDSMTPTIPSGSLLVVNQSDCLLREGIYVVCRGESLLVKRTLPRENNMVRLKSDNPQYESEDIDLKDPSQNFQIFGRVIWVGHSI